MKKKSLLSFLVVAVVLLTACVLFIPNAKAATDGVLTYEIVDGEATITDCDTSASGALVIPSILGGCPVTSIGERAFYYCSRLTSIDIPDSVTSIGESAFSDCSSLTSVAIPASVTSIGDKAFFYCVRLTSVEIPDSVTRIGSHAFYECSSLTSIEIPTSVTSIGDSAFSECSSLTSIEIPASVTFIGDYAFSNTDSLSEINVSVNNISYCSDNGVLFNKAKTTLVRYPEGKTESSYVIPTSVTSIGNRAFCYCSSLTSIDIPDSVTSIGTWAFYGCSNLNGVYITDIAMWCNIYFYDYFSNPLFYAEKLYLNNELVTELIIPNGVTSISGCAFTVCSDLTSIEIPDTVTSIGNHAFYECHSLTSVEIPDSVTSIGGYAFMYCSSLTNIEIPDSVTVIGDATFYNCSSLTNIEIPDNVTSIGERAFMYCSSLTNIEIPDSVTVIGDYAFEDCSSLTNIEIPDSVTSIGYDTFRYCSSLTSIVIPDSVTGIGDGAFEFCDSLNTVYYGGTAEDWGKISIGSYGNDTLLNANIIYNYVVDPKVEAIESAIAGTSLKLGVMGNNEAVIIAPTSKNGKAMTAAELEAMFSDSNVTIESSNGVIGTGCKVTIGQYEAEIAVKGDIDGDGIATVFDALMVKKVLANNGFENEALKEFAGDVDGAGVTDSADVDAILAHIVGSSYIG